MVLMDSVTVALSFVLVICAMYLGDFRLLTQASVARDMLSNCFLGLG